MSLEREVCSCAELQVLSCYRGWKEACQAARAISTTSRHELSSSSFFYARQDDEGNSRLSERNIRGTCTKVCRRQKLGGQFKCGDFSFCNVPCPGRPKTVTIPEIIDQIHELILEDRRISAQSIAEQLGISRERDGSTIHEDLDIRKLSASGSRNAWTRIKNVKGASCLSNFWNFFGTIQMISCLDWWLWTKYGYITMTRRQSNNQWSGGIAAHPAPKFPSAKTRWKSFRLDFFGIKAASSIFIIFQKVKLSTRSIIHLCWCNWGTFRRKNAAESSPRGSCSCTTIPRLTGHLLPRIYWPTWASYILITKRPLRICPRRTTTCSLDWKKTIEKSSFFVRRGCHCCRRDLVRRTNFWFFFFEWLKKFRATG